MRGVNSPRAEANGSWEDRLCPLSVTQIRRIVNVLEDLLEEDFAEWDRMLHKFHTDDVLQDKVDEVLETMMGSAHDCEASALRQAVCIHLLNNIDLFRSDSEFPVSLPMPEQEWQRLPAHSGGRAL